MAGGRRKGVGRAHMPLLAARSPFVPALPALVLAALVLMAPARAQTRLPSADAPQAGPSAEDLRGLELAIAKAFEEQRRLNAEIESAAADTQQLRRNLVEVARRLRAAEERVAGAEARLAEIEGRQRGLRRSLQARDAISSEVLAAMQRIGRKPPPALLVQPGDALLAMRAAVLLGAVVPEMREEARILIADLQSATALAEENRKVTVVLRSERDATDAERHRLAGLLELRQKQVSTSREQLEQEKARMGALSRDAKSLRDLIAKGEAEAIGNAHAIEIARRAPPPVKEGGELATAAGGARLSPRVSFAQRRGQLNWPVSGTVSKRFGARDALGGVERGVTFAAIGGAVVTAPADGWVHFAAPFRGYGQLLIINAGSGYHVVLAGMDRLVVEIGQFVLAGEPVGFMPASAGARGTELRGAELRGADVAATGASPASAAASPAGAAAPNGGASPQEGLGGARPALYVEFRKDGSPVDPSPWWTSQIAEKARG